MFYITCQSTHKTKTMHFFQPGLKRKRPLTILHKFVFFISNVNNSQCLQCQSMAAKVAAKVRVGQQRNLHEASKRVIVIKNTNG